jgi:Ca2+-binding EF-hand superfamily protein
MTRAYAILASLILIATPLAGCTSSPEIEEIVDDILGCMDENAENYDDNATAELLGNCIYLASMEAFMTAMTEQMEIDEMLETMPQAGYSMLITTSEWNSDMNMQMDVTIEEIVMADLDTDSVYTKMGMSMVPFMTYEYTQVQVGELVNVHYAVGGMMAGDGAGMGSYQTRDATPDVMETISTLVSASDAGDAGDEMGLNLPTGDISDLSSEMPADTEPVITYVGETGVQTMTLEYTNDTGHTTSIVILIDDNKDLMSYDISTDNGSASSSISYTVMWGDSVVIEVDDTLPRTSIPINFHIDGMPEDNWDDDDDDDDGDDGGDGGDDENDVYWQDYWSGYCEWNGNSGDEETVWWCKESQDDEDWDTWWYYCEDHEDDGWHCTDDFGQSESYEWESGGDEWSGSADDGPPTPEEAMADVDTDGDGYMSYQEFQDSWDSDPENPELDYDEVTILFDDCDYDVNDLIDIDEMQCFVDGIVDMLPDGGGEDPEQMMDYMDTNDDGYLSLQELIDFLNNDREQNGEEPMSSDEEEETASWFSYGDTDGDDLLNLDEFTQMFGDDDDDDDGGDGDDPSADEVFEWMNTDGDGQVTPSEWADFSNSTGDIIDEDNFNGLVYTMDMYDYDDSDGLDIYEFAEMWDEINHDDEGDDGDDEPFRVTMMVMGQTLNAPISDFEVRFLFDCGEPDEEGNEPPISNCTVAASNGLTDGSATVDPALTEYVFTYEYLDYDGDGLISDMDTLVIDNLWPDVRVELYDTWADQYTSESFATAEMLPGFGALMVTIGLLGAAMAGRRD